MSPRRGPDPPASAADTPDVPEAALRADANGATNPRPTPDAPSPAGDPLDPEIESLIAATALPAPIAELLLRVARRGAGAPRATAALIEELIDHFSSGLEAGVEPDELVRGFERERRHDERLVAAAQQRRARLDTEAPRGRHLLRGFAGDLRTALRALARRPLFALGNVATLALGIGGAVALFALFEAILLRPLPYAEPDELYFVREETAEGRPRFPSYPNFVDFRRQEHLFDGVVSTTWGGDTTVLGAERPLRVRALGVSRDFFDVLGVRPIQGRTFLPEEGVPGGPPVAIVTEELWRRALGAREDLDGLLLTIASEQYRVIGVLPKGFRFLEPADLYVCHERYPGTVRGAHAYQVVVRLEDGVSSESAEAELDALAARIQEEYGEETEMVATTWTPLRERIVGSFDGVVAALFGASLLVLLVASANVGASLLARGRRRCAEIAVRRSLGATRGRLASQLLAEAALIAIPALALGCGLALAAIEWVRRLGAEQVPRLAEAHVDRQALLFALALSLVATLLFSALPIRQSLRTPAAWALRAGALGPRRGRLGWGLLIGTQIAIAFLLLAGAGLLMRTLTRVASAELGFQVDGVAAAHVHLPSSRYPDPEARLRFSERVREELGALPGVERTALANLLPYDWGTWSAPVVAREEPEEWLAIAGWRLITPEYFSLLDIPILEGQTLPEEGLVDGNTAVVINESLARRLAPGASAVGRVVRSNFDPRFEWLTVVGVVGEARHWRAERGEQPEVYVHQAARPEAVAAEIVLLETRGSPRSLFRAAEDRMRELDPDVPIELVALTETLAETLERERLAAAVLGLFALVVLALTVVGILGVVARAVAERTREAGIRQALGATPRQIVRLLQREVLLPVALGALGGLALALVSSRALDSLLYEVAPTDLPTYLAVTVVLTLIAFAASLWPARRILREDPVRAMRSE
ncbi:MAG TPA: ADOP family duplicated permease [Thermoanaerobaculia bacterium]|nr:ADOP family duplicated permease [Thermoanaerobaculia bacterium]